jgi:hypothetical protein
MRGRRAVGVCLVAVALGIAVAVGSPCSVLYECHDHQDERDDGYDLRVDEVDHWTTTEYGGTIAVRVQGVVRNTSLTARLARPEGERLDSAELGRPNATGTAHTSTVWLDPGGVVSGEYVVVLTSSVRDEPLVERRLSYDGPDATLEVATSVETFTAAWVEDCDNVLGRTVAVEVDVRNAGDVDQGFDVTVSIDDRTRDGRLYLAPGERRRVNWTFDQLPYRDGNGERIAGGVYIASVRVAAGNLTVADRTARVELPTLNDDRTCKDNE